MIAANFGQLFIPIKRDKWLTGCVPILYGAKCSAEFLKRTRQGIFFLKNVFEFGNQGITQFLGGANLFEFSRGSYLGYPRRGKQILWTKRCKEFEIEKGRFSFRLTAPYREERRRAASEAAKNE